MNIMVIFILLIIISCFYIIILTVEKKCLKGIVDHLERRISSRDAKSVGLDRVWSLTLWYRNLTHFQVPEYVNSEPVVQSSSHPWSAYGRCVTVSISSVSPQALTLKRIQTPMICSTSNNKRLCSQKIYEPMFNSNFLCAFQIIFCSYKLQTINSNSKSIVNEFNEILLSIILSGLCKIHFAFEELKAA